MVSAGPTPGSTPIAVPSVTPRKPHIRFFNVSATAKPDIRALKVSIASSRMDPWVRLNPSASVKIRNTTMARTMAMIASRAIRLLPNPRATSTKSSVEAMMKPAQPMIAMCSSTPAVMMTNADQSGLSCASSSGTLRQPPATACHASTAPKSVRPQPMT
jgi:hypothetical protein